MLLTISSYVFYQCDPSTSFYTDSLSTQSACVESSRVCTQDMGRWTAGQYALSEEGLLGFSLSNLAFFLSGVAEDFYVCNSVVIFLCGFRSIGFPGLLVSKSIILSPHLAVERDRHWYYVGYKFAEEQAGAELQYKLGQS